MLDITFQHILPVVRFMSPATLNLLPECLFINIVNVQGFLRTGSIKAWDFLKRKKETERKEFQ